jgi:hypothetical protein
MSVVSPGTPVSSTNKTGRHDISVILLKVALNTINPNHKTRRNETSTKNILTSLKSLWEQVNQTA